MKKHLIELTEKENECLKEIKIYERINNINNTIKFLIRSHLITIEKIKKENE